VLTDNPLDDAVAGIDYPSAESAHASMRRRRSPAGTLGVLEELSAWTAGVQASDPPRPFHRVRLVGFGGEPGPDVQALAEAAGVGIVNLPQAPALVDRASCEAVLVAGIEAADREAEAGADLLIAAGLGERTLVPAATLISVLTDLEPIKVIGRPPGSDDADWIDRCTEIRDVRRRAWPHRIDLLELLAVIGSAELAGLTGLLLQAARRRTPVLLDGVPAAAAATAAQLACPRVVRWLQAAQLSPDPAHGHALQRLGLNPILRLELWSGDGLGGLLALPVLQAAIGGLAVSEQRGRHGSD
jgi:nicotinate-nucleotide--dimethylbenzimidazole phosphoribosyltransferase